MTFERDIVHDVECYPNFFSVGFYSMLYGTYRVFEISEWHNDAGLLVEFLEALVNANMRLDGFNSLAYDEPLLYYIWENPTHGPAEIYNKSCEILGIGVEHAAPFARQIAPWLRRIEQLDLFKIHHFDNQNRLTSLKVVEFNMRAENLQDLPYPPGTFLNYEQSRHVIDYMGNDIKETAQFAKYTGRMIEFREQMGGELGYSVINHNDTKLGKDYFIKELEKAQPGICYDRSSGRKEPRQTLRYGFPVAPLLLDCIQFRSAEFRRIHEWFKEQTIYETKGVFEDVTCTVGGVEYVFGLGGIHGSMENSIVLSDDYYMILDVDVTSYYPSLAIEHNMYPEHLGELFCKIYADLKRQRVERYPDKKSAMNKALKLALNGVYGDSNNPHSPFYDPAYTMRVTINGQLLLCMLAEWVNDLMDTMVIQANTDGITLRCPRFMEQAVKDVCTQWERVTKLQLEYAEYSRMFIANVNNYIAESTDGKLKRKGLAFAWKTIATHGDKETDLEWHRNHSCVIVGKAVEKALVNGVPVEQTVANNSDVFDFMICAKVPKSNLLILDGCEIQKTSRVAVTKHGGKLEKVMPPQRKRVPTRREIYQVFKDGQWLHDYVRKVTKQNDRRAEKENPGCEIVKTEVNPGYVAVGPERRQNYTTPGLSLTGAKVTEYNDIRKARREDIDESWYINEAKKTIEKLRVIR